ncbi:MAG: hypothetical protein M5U26_14570 [Planctomycetota bacterium]|nr:hypothetical protein [Planctomycetota bacterium]
MSRERLHVWPALLLAALAFDARAGEDAVPAAEPLAAENEWARKLEAVRAKLRGGEVLFKDDFDREELGAEWIVEEGAWKTSKAAGREGAGVLGAPGATYPDSFLWTKRSFKGDLVVEFDAVCESDPAHDINFVICGKAPNYPPPEKPMYLFGLGGWGNTMTGVERGPDYKWKALTGLFTIEKGRLYRVVAARLGSKFYLFVDDRLVTMAADPDPLPNEGQFALQVYRSAVRFSNLVLRKPGK